MDPRDFHTLASSLAAGKTAAEFRSAISRSYYAVFNVGAEILRGMGFVIGKGAAAHAEVERCLSNSGDAEVAAVGAELGALHSRRNRSDYHLDRTDVESDKTARAIVTQAAQMIRALDDSFSGARRTQLQTTIRQWRRDNGYP